MRSSVLDTHRSPKVEVKNPRSATVQPPHPPNPYSSYRPAKATTRWSWRRIKLAPAEGWLPLILLAVALYSVVFSIIAVNWVNHINLLFLSPAIGLLVGVLIAKLPRFSQAILHLAACLVGYWLSIWMTNSLAFHIPWQEVLIDLRETLTGGLAVGGTAASEIIFFFYLAFLTYFLGYFGSWLVYRAHLPWLVVLVYCSIMLVNLNYVSESYYYLTIILLGALLILVAHMHISTQIATWVRDGLYTDQAWRRNLLARGLRFACAATLIIMLISWFMPIQAQSNTGKVLWNYIDNAWTNIVNNRVSWQNPGAIFQPYQPSANFFSDQLTVTGTVNLPPGEVLRYTSTAGPTYLEGFTYDQFNGHTWTSSQDGTDTRQFNANEIQPSDNISSGTSLVTTKVTIIVAPQGPRHYIFSPPHPVSFDVPTTVYTNGITSAWTQQEALSNGESYRVVSQPPVSDQQTLSNIPLPSLSPQLWQSDANYTQISLYYVQVPHDLSPEVLKLTSQWTKGAGDTYSALKALESHLSDPNVFKYSVDNPPVPNNIDAVDWLLRKHVGYCTYYATAMTVMARQLGIPTRIVNGFSQGSPDPQGKEWVVNGSDAHSWVQAYFPNYGWVNFDPTPGYSLDVAKIQHASTPPVAKTPAPNPTVGATAPVKKPTAPVSHQQASAKAQAPVSDHPVLSAEILVGGSILFLLISLLVFLLALVSYWWRNLYAGYSAAAALFWRFCHLASWTGHAPRTWQTPYEYSAMLSQHFPHRAAPIHHLTELFVRERWGRPIHLPQNQREKMAQQLWPLLRSMFLQGILRKIKR
ncbi:DUF4129 domain-containing protein [Ktedonosporobacter rubrisoli]|uniref:DUF4129 domain-containing protein n=1 Tax=Ktedonosporobacter rubrisoli TaxID=2509675 RepID=A0A4P6K070_KTERU|nr:transglutaminaseTgpA domain-containing protein [Ktedonosporobacter rubrisoli]QBD81439.1 DUF4129 domain-containing protein [Ktedonosporobacter rubrisoli]